MPPLPCRSFVALHALAILMISGCSAVRSQTDANLAADQVDQSTPSVCTVELRKRRTKTIEIPVGNETRVQDVLEASKATSAFRRLDVTILRKTQNPSQPVLRLVSDYHPKNRSVSLQTDYAILPGDNVVVRESRTSPMDDALKSVFGR